MLLEKPDILEHLYINLLTSQERIRKAFLGVKFNTLDIRDIKEDVIYPTGQALQQIFNLQLVLVDHYTKIESLPEYPIDINTKIGQDLIKDFTSRIIEEFGEGFESYILMVDMFHRGVDEQQMIPHLQNFNEEISDALHFWLELMIFSNFMPSSLIKWFEAKSYGALEHIFGLANYLLESELEQKRYPGRWVIKDHQLRDEFLRGGRLLSTDRLERMKMMLWDITYWLMIARNTLKNKPWKQTHMLTDTNQYEWAITNATICMFKFFVFTGFTPESLYTIYYKKNKVNQFRIRSAY